MYFEGDVFDVIVVCGFGGGVLGLESIELPGDEFI
jgi:hypothetical protein